MEPIEIKIRIIVSKEGDIKVISEKQEDHPEAVPRLPSELPVTFEIICERWPLKIGKKEKETCVGCTIQCHLRTRYNGQNPLKIVRGEQIRKDQM